MGNSAAPPDGRRLRWAQHRAQRRAAFVDAGVRAIDQYGPAASAEQIADLAGVSRTVLYRYFRDLEDLRQAIAEHTVDALVDSVLPSLVLSPQATPREIISGAIEVIIGWLDEHPEPLLLPARPPDWTVARRAWRPLWRTRLLRY